MREKLTIRLACKTDEERIMELGRKAGMGTLGGFDETLVACLEDGTIAGFCRVRTIEGVAYINPIVVDESLRRCGIGTTLMDAAQSAHGELRFVARGCAVPFYRALGCDEVPWSDIDPAIACDCDECAGFDSCRPIPMRMQPGGRRA